jgi:hypothetical protein
MEVQFLIFHDDGDNPDQILTFDLPAMPLVDDLVTISRPDQEGYTNYVVRRRQWDLEFAGENPTHRAGEVVVGRTAAVIVECVYAVGSFASEEHKRSIKIPDPANGQ